MVLHTVQDHVLQDAPSREHQDIATPICEGHFPLNLFLS